MIVAPPCEGFRGEGACSLATRVFTLNLSRPHKKRQQAGVFFDQDALLAGARLVTQSLDLVMVALHAVVLTLNQITDTHQVVFADFLQRFLVGLERMVFATLGFVEHRFFILTGEHGFHVHPTTVQVTGKDEEAVLNEAERGEDHALKAYKEALEKITKHNLVGIRDLVERQYHGVQRNHDQVKALRNQARARAS